MNLAALLYDVKPLLLLLVLPPVPLLVLILMGAGLLRRHRHLGRTVLTLGVLGLWFSSCDITGDWLADHGVHAPRALSGDRLAALRVESQAQRNVAVLVLGGGARSLSPEYLGPSLRAISLERLRYGVWLARHLSAPLGFSGGIGWNAQKLKQSEASVAEKTAKEEYGLPLTWAEGRSRDTRENAELSLALLKADGIKKIVLVTHDLHMPRAQQAFVEAAQGQIEIVAAPVGAPTDLPADIGDWLPSDTGFARVRYAIYEWLGRKAGH